MSFRRACWQHWLLWVEVSGAEGRGWSLGWGEWGVGRRVERRGLGEGLREGGGGHLV